MHLNEKISKLQLYSVRGDMTTVIFDLLNAHLLPVLQYLYEAITFAQCVARHVENSILFSHAVRLVTRESFWLSNCMRQENIYVFT